MTTFYEGESGLRELGAPRFEAARIDGRWGVREPRSPLKAWCVVRYETPEAAEAYADLLNAYDEGQPRKVLDDLRRDLERVRAPMRMQDGERES